MKFAKKIILITGATGGLGKQMCHQFIEQGAHLILTDLNADKLQELDDELAGKKGLVLGTITANLASDEGCNSIYDGVLDISEELDILINNAGIAALGKFADIPQDEWEKVISINLLAPMRLTYKFLPGMIRRQSGHIVNISSAAGIVASEYFVTYSTSKFGLKGFGNALADELIENNIYVTNLYPFFTRTNILESPRFGLAKDIKLPSIIVESPESVIKDLLKGIENKTINVFPGMVSPLLDLNQRLFPGGLTVIKRFAQKLMSGWDKD